MLLASVVALSRILVPNPKEIAALRNGFVLRLILRLMLGEKIANTES